MSSPETLQMGPLPVPERNGSLSLQEYQPQPYTPVLSPNSRSSSKSPVSDPRSPCSSSDSANTVTATPNTEFEDTGVARYPRKRPRGDSQHASPEPKRCKIAVQEENLLCQNCQQIDFQKVLDVDILSLQREDNGMLLADLGKRCNDLSTARGCPLCHLFHQSRVQRKASSGYQLRIYSYMRSTKAIAFGLSRHHHRSKDIPCLGVVPYGMTGKTFRCHADAAGQLFCLKEDAYDDSLFKPRIRDQNASLSQVKTWLDFCASHHSGCQNRERQVTGLKLMDCETYEVVPAPANANYVALSYVWGTTVSQDETPAMEDGTHNLDPRITKTIRDAVTAAKDLGYKYLWVDKLCIDQSSSEEKHHQISQMDAIYGSADLTIIAACGQDCHYGLPGVNGTSRTPQPCVKAGQIDIVSSMRHPHHHVRSSKWITRGWTLQEACLSTRRLVFLDDQVYFECNTMHCHETVIPNLNLIHNSKKNIFPCFQSGILSIIMGRRFAEAEPKDSYDHYRLYLNLVVQYTKRTLTFEADRPKAFAGISRHFAKELFELWGVSHRPGSQSDIEDSFIRGLLWAYLGPLEQARNAKDGEDSAIDMTLILPDSASIPSWSWMSWRGEISFPHSSSIVHSTVHSIRLETGQDSSVRLYHFHPATPAETEPVLPSHMKPPKVLLLDVDCVDVSEISLDSTGNLRVYDKETSWYISRGPLQPRALYELFNSEKLVLLYLAYNHGADKGYFMIVERAVGFAVRTGICIAQKMPDGLPSIAPRKLIRLA